MHRPFALVGLSALLASLGCGQARSDQAGGSVGQGLLVPSGASVSLATYAIAGPNGFASAGTVPVADSPDVTVVVSHLPVGVGYELELSATASDDLTVCEGSTTFDVTDSNATSTLVVHLECAVRSGEASVLGVLNTCPVIDALDALPTTLRLGGVASLSVVAHDSDSQPAALAYSWSVNGARLPRQTASTLGFACSSPGEVTIAAIVSDGDPDPSCRDSLSLKVSCE